MADFVTVTVTDSAVVSGGEMHTIQFRPEQPGTIAVRATAKDPPTHSETGQLGRLDLLPPGRTKPITSVNVPVGQDLLALGYAATQADLSTSGSWVCRLFNATEVDISFDTAISYPSLTPLQHKTATFDVELLNIILAKAIAASGLGFHIESSANSDDARSYVSWAQNVGDLLPAPYKGTTEYFFPVPDQRVESDFSLASATWVVLRISDVDSDPTTPPQAFVGAENSVPTLRVTLALKPDTAKVTAIDSDVDLDKLDIELDINSLTIDAQIDFYGHGLAITPQLSATVKVAGIVVDLSDYINGKVQSAVNDHAATLDTSSLRHFLDEFFVNLLRLGNQAAVVAYETDGYTLTVSYTVPGKVSPLPHPIPIGVAEP